MENVLSNIKCMLCHSFFPKKIQVSSSKNRLDWLNVFPSIVWILDTRQVNVSACAVLQEGKLDFIFYCFDFVLRYCPCLQLNTRWSCHGATKFNISIIRRLALTNMIIGTKQNDYSLRLDSLILIQLSLWLYQLFWDKTLLCKTQNLNGN